MTLKPEVLAALTEIERQVGIIRHSDDDNGIPVIPVEGDLQVAINQASSDGVILDLLGRQHIKAITVNKPITLRNGIVQAPPNTNDLVILSTDHISFQNIVVQGDGTTKRGINNGATHVTLDNVQIKNIRRLGQESQAMAMWNSPGPLTARNTVFEGGSIGFLGGGARSTVENTIPTDLLFESCIFTRPLEWRGLGYACKNGFELKSGRNVTLRSCIIEHVWVEGQTGSGIVLTPVNYGNSPETIVENVVFDSCIVRNVGNGVNLLGFGQEANPTQRANNIAFRNCEFGISRVQYGDQGALLKVGNEPRAIEFNGCNVVTDGDAFIRVSDSRPITDFRFTNTVVNRTGTYGVFTPIGSRGVGFLTIFPAGVMENNTFYGAHSIFRANFPNNVYQA